MQDCHYFEVDGLVYGTNLHTFRGLGFFSFMRAPYSALRNLKQLETKVSNNAN